MRRDYIDKLKSMPYIKMKQQNFIGKEKEVITVDGRTAH